MNQLFEVKVCYERQADDIGMKKVVETYLVDAMSFTEAEERAIKEVTPLVSIGELEVDACRKRRISEILESGHDRWFEAKVAFITINEKTLEEKRTVCAMLVQSDTLPNALADLTKELDKQLGSYEVTSIKESPIIEYFRYGTEEVLD